MLMFNDKMNNSIAIQNNIENIKLLLGAPYPVLPYLLYAINKNAKYDQICG